MDGRMFADAMANLVIGLIAIALLIGVLFGGIIFEVIPWLYHHLSFHWN